MRYLPLAAIALAAAALLPPGVSANTRRSRLTPAPARMLALHTTRSAQHPQPLVFRAGEHSRNPRHPVTSSRPHHPGTLHAAALPRSSRHSSRSRLVPVSSQRHRSSRRLAVRDLPPYRSARLQQDETARPANVVSLIRPAASRPQLPNVQDVAASPMILPTLYNDRGHLIMPAPLVGSHEILVHQNTQADQDGLGRVQDDADLDGMRLKGMLVDLPQNATLHVDARLPGNRRLCRPWTARFLSDLSHDFYARFQTPLQVNSAVRTVAFQQHLQHINGNAAPAEGDTASPHLTGQAIDLAKRGLSLPQIAWLRGYLLLRIEQGNIDVEEEFRQSCFHISVYQSYVRPYTLPQQITVSSRSTSALATALR